jgi:HSP20 family molecular chaperone IbpA
MEEEKSVDMLVKVARKHDWLVRPIERGDIQDSPGIMIPGIGHVGGQRAPQPRPQQPMQPRPQQPMQPRPVQQQPPYVQPPTAQQPPYVQQPTAQQPHYVQQPVQQVPRQIPVQQQVPQFPNVETAVTADASYMFMDLSGVKRGTLSISFNNGNLVISGKRESNLDILKAELTKKSNGRKNNPFISKVDTVPRYLKGAFTFEYPFARMIDESAIVATLEDGILKIVLPHRAKGEAVSVAIR